MTGHHTEATDDAFRDSVVACRERGHLQPWFADRVLALIDQADAYRDLEAAARAYLRGTAGDETRGILQAALARLDRERTRCPR